MSSTAIAGPSATQLGNTGSQKQAFEFTRRKRWADLLITELSDAVILILSPACKIWFCGNAVSELLGWRDEELIDQDFTDVMNGDDQIKFLNAFSDSCRTRTELLCYVRLKCKNEFSQDARDYSTSPKEVLFEFKGYPHFVQDEMECKCFFAMARPYPSRNTAMLNTFLELKVENERLHQRLNELQQHVAQKAVISAGGQLPSDHTGGYPGYSNPMPMPLSMPMTLNPPVPESYYRSAGNSASYESGTFTNLRSSQLKKNHLGDQHVCVTCGRTDSPEWRKGPQGPKTLCNACGLRWAKQQRKFDADLAENSGDPTLGVGSSGQVQSY
ncbi:hypothetical protein GLOTRDRAFT_71884 [Gloeophyllum trabeum ATCC 11539]|uniref:GATA-type domain-containing protein n=1 Tax=Gloeophyllum trabeum (strain ATCC 11539 / FP-39264 / Madison 617) TaxID=670483 RepID=S7RTC9_GLOTA|nr:uncharacterized protein GLOTRDRAFT_71884 [Gloeophyllum trabeum ATCC 11539]EPQ57940.1 hypothetical protein GLOTRDRAFT_71884 [Gloeophyllum trabeum ATCC 11539]